MEDGLLRWDGGLGVEPQLAAAYCGGALLVSTPWFFQCAALCIRLRHLKPAIRLLDPKGFTLRACL